MPSIAKIRRTKGNQTCADCPTEKPQWVAFLGVCEDIKTKISVEGLLAVLVCDACAEHHRSQLGSKPKSLENTAEWTTKELTIVENSGNAFVNGFYEAVNFNADNKTKARKEDRATFIKAKYKNCKYRNDVSLEMALSKMQPTKLIEGEQKNKSPNNKETQKPQDPGDENRSSGPFTNLASLVEKKAKPADQKECSVDERKLQKLAGGMAKATKGLNDSGDDTDKPTLQIPDITDATKMLHYAQTYQPGAQTETKSAGAFSGLAGKVGKLTMKGPQVDPFKLKKLTQGMATVKDDLEQGEEQEQDLDKDMSTALPQTPDFKGLIAAKKYGAKMARAYDEDEDHMRQLANEVMGSKGR